MKTYYFILYRVDWKLESVCSEHNCSSVEQGLACMCQTCSTDKVVDKGWVACVRRVRQTKWSIRVGLRVSDVFHRQGGR